MEPSNPYFDQVRLLVEILPLIARRTEFALKGGTAINLFFRDMPRLSVDIDLVYLPNQDRKKSLTVIDAALIGLAEELEKGASAKDLSRIYSQEFEGMDDRSTSLETLVEARRRLVKAIHQSLTDNDKEFLIGLKSGMPDWNRFPIPGAGELPAIRWKLYNLKRMEMSKRDRAMKKLAKVLADGPTRI